MAQQGEEDRAALIAQASDWLSRLDVGHATAEQLETWRGADPRRAAAFAEVAGTWSRLDVLRQAPDRAAPEDAAKGRGPGLPRRALIGGGGALAASLAGLAYVERDLLLRVGVRTAIGERRTVALPDGSSVELNTDTRLAWRFDGRARKLWLDRGEAALTIAVDATRPFLLMAAEAVTHLTPGQFNARLRSGALDLIVLAGHAAVRAAAGTAQAEVTGPGDPRRVLEVGPSRIEAAPLAEDQAQNVQAWRRGEIVFDGQPLSTAVEEYNRYLTKKIVIGDPSVGALRLGGRFLTGDPESFLTALRYSFGLRIIDGEQSRILLKT